MAHLEAAVPISKLRNMAKLAAQKYGDWAIRSTEFGYLLDILEEKCLERGYTMTLNEGGEDVRPSQA